MSELHAILLTCWLLLAFEDAGGIRGDWADFEEWLEDPVSAEEAEARYRREPEWNRER